MIGVKDRSNYGNKSDIKSLFKEANEKREIGEENGTVYHKSEVLPEVPLPACFASFCEAL